MWPTPIGRGVAHDVAGGSGWAGSILRLAGIAAVTTGLLIEAGSEHRLLTSFASIDNNSSAFGLYGEELAPS
jgi:hypothetical protein